MVFQKVVLTIAFVLLIIILAVIGLLIRSAKKTAKFPPETSKCPDYWKVSTDANGNIECKNPLNLGSGCANIPIGNDEYSGTSVASIVAKCKMAKNTCGVTWDGITNVVNNVTEQPYC